MKQAFVIRNRAPIAIKGARDSLGGPRNDMKENLDFKILDRRRVVSTQAHNITGGEDRANL